MEGGVKEEVTLLAGTACDNVGPRQYNMRVRDSPSPEGITNTIEKHSLPPLGA